MRLFTSKRERRLWICVAAVVVAIYSSLLLGRPLAAALRESGLLTLLFAVGMLLVGATIVVHGLRTRPGGREIGVILGIVAAYFMVFVRMGIVEERTHIIEYGVLAVFVHEALCERRRSGGNPPVPAILAIAASSCVGLADECIQLVVPGRIFDPRDILFNVLAGGMAVVASVLLQWARRRRSGPKAAKHA